jgi:fructokinase
MPAILCIGEMLMDLIPEPGMAAEALPCYRPHPGGAPANVAVAVARLGGKARFLGVLAHDSFGQRLLDVLRTEGVDTRYVRVTDAGPTALALVSLDAGGQPRFSFYRQGAADTLLAPTDLASAAWQDTAVLLAGSVALATEPCRSAVLAAMDRTREQGALVAFDANIRPELWPAPGALRDALAQAMARSDILKLNASELAFVAGEGKSPDAWPAALLPPVPAPAPAPPAAWLAEAGRALLARGCRLVLVTSGAAGAFLLTPWAEALVPAHPVTAADTTGAGDAFTAAVLHQLIRLGYHTPAALARLGAAELRGIGTYATRAAALSCTRPGGIPAMPYAAELDPDAPGESSD